MRQDLSANTRESYRSDLLLFARWFSDTTDEAFSPTSVTPTDIREYRAYLINVERRAPTTVNRRLAALRKFFHWAQANAYIKESPTDNVREIQLTPPAPKALDKRAVDKLLRAAERDGNKRNLAILQVLRSTGLRVAELCALRLDDVEISERSGRLQVRSGKGSKHRTVPLNLDARRALSAYLAVRPTVQSDALFVSQRRGALKVRAVESMVANYARLAGLEDVSPHTLRHTFGKATLDAGADLPTVATLMGHTNINTTARYTKPSAKDLELAVEKIASDYLATTTTERR